MYRFVVALLAILTAACAATLPRAASQAKLPPDFLIIAHAKGEAVDGYAMQKMYLPTGDGAILGAPRENGTRFNYDASAKNIYIHPPKTPKTETYQWSLSNASPYKPSTGFNGYAIVDFHVYDDGVQPSFNNFTFQGPRRTLVAQVPLSFAGFALCHVRSLGPFAASAPGGYLQLLWRKKIAFTHRNCTDVTLTAA